MYPRQVLSTRQVQEQLYELMKCCNRGVITDDEYKAICKWFDHLTGRLEDRSNPKEMFGPPASTWWGKNHHKRFLWELIPKSRKVEVELEFAANDDAVQILHFSLTPPI